MFIGQDPEKFIEDGGWEFLNMEASDSDSEKSEESDEGYEPSDVEVVSESEDDDSDDESVVESEDDEVRFSFFLEFSSVYVLRTCPSI